ncbi:multidrug ABC transporter ATP-binding protein [Acuticoccus sediminis]|uniref:Multidrug ABC transporter ATP-binding protein n=1 Tax=Acuticoccus sediminis TaxID=2184697 RepID=A0A8B2NVA1_9HYPH|nr:ABC transporter ATP-binding protein [Acuticoccus sediminis]RAH99566.1 multidrug ABC transporter ATP-binding protein [Acuticoccus sediminis]
MLGFFERLVDPYPARATETPPNRFLAFMWHFSRDVWPWVAMMCVLSAAIGLGEAFLFGFLGTLVDWLATRDPVSLMAEDGTTLALVGAAILIGLPTLVTLQSVLLHQTLAGNYTMLVRWLSHRHLLRMPVSFYADEFAGRIATKVMQTAIAVRDVALRVCDVFTYVISFFVGMVVVAAQADWRLMIPLLVWAAIYSVMLWWFIPRLGRASEAQADARSMMTGRVVDAYTNIQTVKLFSHADRERDYSREAMDGFLGTVHRQMRLITGFNVFNYALNALLLFAIGALGIYFWTVDSISLGALAVSVTLVLRLNGLSHWVMWEMTMLFEAVGTIVDGQRMLSRSPTVTDVPAAPVLTVPRGEIRFEGIRFHYGKAKGVIDHLDLTVRPGEKIGLVGPSGAGKTTLMNLLLRLHDLEAGRILIDGQDIAAVTQDSLRAAIGVVSQEPALLHRSIRDNIVYGRPDATEADLREAARRANALDFIEGLSDAQGRTGFDAYVGERGVKLSGGQRQRIAIARVFLKNAPILVLDEATSALDSEVEAAIQESLFALMEGKTVIAIAHRLSTIASLDRLVVLEKGRVVEEGRHTDLAAAGGLYARLWSRQSGGFISADIVEEPAE